MDVAGRYAASYPFLPIALGLRGIIVPPTGCFAMPGIR